MSIEKYGMYEYQIIKEEKGFVYEIYTDNEDYGFYTKTNVIRESTEWFETDQEARFAAIGHIVSLENGER